jgi:hypothetical protein
MIMGSEKSKCPLHLAFFRLIIVLSANNGNPSFLASDFISFNLPTELYGQIKRDFNLGEIIIISKHPNSSLNEFVPVELW